MSGLCLKTGVFLCQSCERTPEKWQNLRYYSAVSYMGLFDRRTCSYPTKTLFLAQKSSPNRAIFGPFELNPFSGWLFEFVLHWLAVSRGLFWLTIRMKMNCLSKFWPFLNGMLWATPTGLSTARLCSKKRVFISAVLNTMFGGLKMPPQGWKQELIVFVLVCGTQIYPPQWKEGW